MSRLTRLGSRLLGRKTRWDEEWVAFSGEVEGRAAAWSVDMGAIAAAPVSSLPYRLDVSVAYPASDASGLPDPNGLSQLEALADAVAATAVQYGGALVGRLASGGTCRFTAHLPAQPKAPVAIPNAPQLQASTEFDPHWAYVRDALSPDERQAHVLSDLAVVATLQEHGDGLTTARPVEFLAYFAVPENAEAAAAELAGQGYKTAIERDDEGEYALSAVLFAPVAPPALHELTWAVHELVDRHEGGFDGWSCPVAL